MYPISKLIENVDPDATGIITRKFRKIEEATVSFTFYGGSKIEKIGTVVTDPMETAYNLAQDAQDYIVISGLEAIRRAGFSVKPLPSGIQDRTFNLPELKAEYAVGFDVTVTAARFKTLIIDLFDLDATETEFFENLEITHEEFET
jgi:hypothetical protein